VTDRRFIKTEVAVQVHIRIDTFEAESRSDDIGHRAKKSYQNIRIFRRFWLPGCDEIAAGPELAKRFSLSLFIWFHLFFRLSEILQIYSVANVLSAGHTNLPKQKPNKITLLQDFFFALWFLF
jgi:hypothetical protein